MHGWKRPAMTIERVGHGAGTRDFARTAEHLAPVRGRSAESAGAASDQIWILETNLDDVPAEVIGYCLEQLFAAGAVDVFTIPIFMKKNRPGVLLSVLAPSGGARRQSKKSCFARR